MTTYSHTPTTHWLKASLTILVTMVLLVGAGVAQNAESLQLRSIPLLKRFEATDYLGGIQNWSFDQDSSGILYVANNDGLLEFDGSKWRLFEVPGCTKVRAVKVDNRNRVLAGGQGQIGYFSMQENTFRFTSLVDQLPANYPHVAETWKIILHNGFTYFLTESQLLEFSDSSGIKVLDLPGYILNAHEAGGALYVQIYDKGLFELIDHELVPIPATDDIPYVIAVIPDGPGRYYFCSSGEVYRQGAEGLARIPVKVDMGTVNAVIRLNSGEYVFGTQNRGLYIFNPDLSLKAHLIKNEGLSDRSIKALYEDGFNNLWIALNNGINYVELRLPLSLINEQTGLMGTGYAACKFNDKAYLGSNNGLFIQSAPERGELNSVYRLIPGSEGQVNNFSAIGNDLILNHHHGAFEVNGTGITQVNDMGSWKFMLTNIPGLALGGDYRGISLYRKINDRWTLYKPVPGLDESSRIMEFEDDSTLWMTHGSKGAFLLSFDSKMKLKGDIRQFGAGSGFPSNNMISVYTLNDKLVFTSENGIFDFNSASGNFIPNAFFNEWLGPEHVSEIASDGENTIYYIQDQKIGVLIQESFGKYRNETGLFTHINKYLNDDLPNISLLDERNVLIGAREGFILYDPIREFSVNEDFHVVLRAVEVSIASDSTMNINPNQKESIKIDKNQPVRFVYAAPYFDGFEEIKFSYRLLPMEKNWSPWDSKSDKEYPYLPAGNYSFEVKALNIYGMESPAASFSFQVPKPWYSSNWAVGIYLFTGLLLLAFIPYIQQKRHLREKTMINLRKEQALKIKNEQINQISQDSRREIDRLTHEKLQTEINLKNDQLTTIAMNLMSTSEFIQDALKRIEANLDEGGSSQELKGIIRSIEKNVSQNETWDQFAYHFDQVHGDYLKKLSENNVRLSPREIKLAAFLRMNMSSKEISKLMNITVRGVELARYRLRKKLKLGRDQNLVEYLIGLDS